ncbi:MAG TPA: hypothetical protein VGH42_04665 [Verrucomicrobiae bacterium]|jgi:hypothetical protein
MKIIQQKRLLMKTILLFYFVATYISGRVEGQGVITSLNNPNEFNPTATLITFAGLNPVTEPTNVAGVRLILQNGQGPDVAFDPSPIREFGPSEQTIIQNIASGFSDLNIYFPSPTFQLGFEMRTWPSENIILTFYSLDSVIDTLTVPTRTTTSDSLSPLLFYGFQSSTTFDHLLIAVRGPNSDFLEIDNLRFTAVPEPGVMLLAVAGLVLWFLPKHCRHRRLTSREAV